MFNKKICLKIDEYEERLIIYSLVELRNKMLEENKDTEAVNELILKLLK